MKTSDQINELCSALSKAQGEMTGAKKASANPFFKSQYADLASVMEAIAKPFSSHGLSYVQSASTVDGWISVTTRILHESGQWIESDPLILPPVKADPQAFGSAVSYAKRYSLQAFAGVPSVDDDGNAAVQGTEEWQKPIRGKDKELAQSYMVQMLQALEAEDAVGLRQLGDELKEQEALMSHVWKQFTTDQKNRIKKLIYQVEAA